MKVLYDYQAFLSQTHGGVTRSFAELIHNMPSDIGTEIAVLESDNVYLREMNLVPGLSPLHMSRATFLGGVDSKWKEFAFNTLNYVPFVNTPKTLNRRNAIGRLESGEYDVFHPTFFDDYFLKHLHGKPFVLTVHDMISDRMSPDAKRNDKWTVSRDHLVACATHIVAVSENTRKDVMELLGVPEDRISVIYHGGPDVDCNALEMTDSPVEGPYILFVGARQVAYKNFKPFVEACVPVLKKRPELRIVCTGGQFSPDEKQFFDELGVADRMLAVFASSEELNRLYHHAEAFVFPSAYEGFGIPILEAFACGCPVLLNNASCFPEVAGDAALYFNMDTLGGVLEDFLSQGSSARAELVSKGFLRLADFSWKKAAESLAGIYRTL